MKYETVYEITKTPFPFDTAWMLIVSIIMLLFGVGGVLNYVRKKDLDWLDIIFSVVAIVVALIIAIHAISLYFNGDGSFTGSISKAYYEGIYHIAEGYIEEHEENSAREDFIVGGMRFGYKKDISNKFTDKGNDINKDGQFVRISYVNFVDDPENHIVKVEVLK